MAIEINNEKNTLIIHVPNSEASVDAQHNGNKDTSVGSYYMSEKQPMVYDFLNDFDGDYFIDLAVVLKNAKEIIIDLKERRLENSFKRKLVSQEKALEVLNWIIKQEGPLYKMPNPSVNENNKYLKFDNMDNTVNIFKTLCLGELCDICIQRIGINDYLIYLQKCDGYDQIIKEKAYKMGELND